jgi:prevent-host-death family protein
MSRSAWDYNIASPRLRAGRPTRRTACLYVSYTWDMSEAAAEMPISEARDHLADVVNRAVYAGTPTHLTRRGRRLAVVVSEAHVAEEDTRAREEATAAACRALWLGVRDADEKTRAAVREVIRHLMDAAEDASDQAAVDAAMSERQAGAQPLQWEQVKAEMGL